VSCEITDVPKYLYCSVLRMIFGEKIKDESDVFLKKGIPWRSKTSKQNYFL